MTEKIIDDYYLNINQTDSADEKTSTKKKLKFISKKPTIDNDDTNDNSKKIIIKTPSPIIEKKEIKEIKENKIIVKKNEENNIKNTEEKKEKIKKEEPKKTFTFNTAKKIEKEIIKDKNNDLQHPHIEVVKENKENLKFSSDKNKKFSFKKNENFSKEKGFSPDKNEKNKKIFKKGNFKKNYEYDDLNKDTSFTRSNKINQKKKEEKNIEDINQNIISRK